MSNKKNLSVNSISVNPVYLSARSAIITPEQAIPVTIYSLNKWLPRLGTGRWSLVQLLRGLCFEIPRRSDGTKRLTISWRYLAECLQVHEETIASWLKHKVIPDDKPWRRIIPSDSYSEYLSLFIPRLRYAYETANGKTKRVGFLLEVLMEDPIAPEDEIKLARQVEMLQMQQGELGLETYRTISAINPPQSELLDLSLQHRNEVTRKVTDLPIGSNSNKTRLTTDKVNRLNSDLPTNVKQHYVDSGQGVMSTNSDLLSSESELNMNNVNELKILINELKKLKHHKRNYQQILEPVITMTETLLEDYHSTAMLYKVLKVLFPKNVDIYIAAVEQALITYANDKSLNKGAMFVKTIREFSENNGINLGFKKQGSSQEPIVIQSDFLSSPPPSNLLQASIEDVIWSETLSVLQGQMTKAMFNSVMQGTTLVGMDKGTYVIKVGTSMAKDWLENRLKSVVARALSNVIGTSVQIEFEL